MFLKIKFTLIACMLFMTGSMILGSASEVQASSCPNGCVQGYEGCFCHQWYWTFSEYQGVGG